MSPPLCSESNTMPSREVHSTYVVMFPFAGLAFGLGLQKGRLCSHEGYTFILVAEAF